MAPACPVRVLVIDDSALMRQVLSQLLASDPAIEVVGTAADPYAARDLIKALNPDVLTLDVEMPRMDGLAFLEKLMRARPMPVVMVSSLTEAGASAALTALELGAVDVIAKPVSLRERLGEWTAEVVGKVKNAATARLAGRGLLRRAPAPRVGAGTRPPRPPARGLFQGSEALIVMGASTGGTEALREVLA